MHPPERKKTTASSLREMKAAGQKITSVTAYDYPTARLASDAGIDVILVGDSLGMTVQGEKHTLKVKLDDIVYHCSCVARAEPLSLVVADMPYASFHLSPEKTAANAIRCVQEGGAEAVKLEGGRKRLPMISAILDAEIPVMGHLGLTPQSLHVMGGFIVQGKIKEKAQEMIEDARALEEVGVFAIVLESIPLELARRISETVKVPTIGIGAGPHCDGQVLVFHDLMGLTSPPLPKFVRPYADIGEACRDALRRYAEDVRSGRFPGDKESYHLGQELDEFLS